MMVAVYNGIALNISSSIIIIIELKFLVGGGSPSWPSPECPPPFLFLLFFSVVEK